MEALAERKDLVRAGIKGVFCGGTTMDKQYARFLVEEVCEGGKIGFVPTYGNTLMGLARHHPISRKTITQLPIMRPSQELSFVSLTQKIINLWPMILGAG